MGAGRRHLRPRLGTTGNHARAGRGVSSFSLHFVLLLHGGLPAVQRAHRIRGRRDDFPGTTVQHASDWRGVEARTACSPDGGRRNPGMRVCTELRGRLPEGYPTDPINLRGRRGSDEAGAWGPVSAITQDFTAEKNNFSSADSHGSTRIKNRTRRHSVGGIPLRDRVVLSSEGTTKKINRG